MINEAENAKKNLATSPLKKSLTIREFTERYGICRATFYNLVNRGELKAHHLLGSTRIKVEEAERWFASLPEVPRKGANGKKFDRRGRT